MKTKKKVLKIRKNIIVLMISTILLVVLLKDNSNILINYRYNAILLFVYLIVNFIFLIKEKYKKIKKSQFRGCNFKKAMLIYRYTKRKKQL